MDLFNHELTEEDLYQMALNRPLEEKIANAIALIQSMENQALQLSPDGFYVAFSGGKDSIVLDKLFEMSGVKYQLWYNNVTIDPPELVRFIKKEYPQAKWNSVGVPLPMYMQNKSYGPPTRLSRWCCEIYKEQGGNGLFKSIGVRCEESKRRKGLWKSVTVNKNQGLVLCPLVYWTTKDIWDFIKANNMPYCCLYDEGFRRLGCIGCPLGGYKNQAKEFKRWPRYEALWKKGFEAYWDKYKGVPRRDGKPRWIERMGTVDDLWQWWISGKRYEAEEKKEKEEGVVDCQNGMW